MDTRNETLVSRSLIFLFILLLPIACLAAGKTDANIQNYSNSTITIEYRILTVSGNVQWKNLGTIDRRSGKIFPQLTIGSVLRAKSGSKIVGKFKVKSPSPGKNQVVLKVR